MRRVLAALAIAVFGCAPVDGESGLPRDASMMSDATRTDAEWRVSSANAWALTQYYGLREMQAAIDRAGPGGRDAHSTDVFNLAAREWRRTREVRPPADAGLAERLEEVVAVVVGESWPAYCRAETAFALALPRVARTVPPSPIACAEEVPARWWTRWP